MQIYLARNQVQAGPYTLTQLNNMLANGQVDINDLMWHEGMTQWQPVGEMTKGQLYYNPNNAASSISSSNRVTVAKLYGKQEPEKKGTKFQSSSSPFSINNKPVVKATSISNNKVNVLASVLKRLLAAFLNFILFSLTLIPISSNKNPDEVYALLENQVEQTVIFKNLLSSTPEHLLIMSGVLAAALIAVQAILLAKRGQSIGKLITGIRVVDKRTNKLASTNVVLIRALLTCVIYYLTPFGLIVIVADLVTMVLNKNKQSLHDKLAKTIVVKADPSQLKDDNKAKYIE